MARPSSAGEANTAPGSRRRHRGSPRRASTPTTEPPCVPTITTSSTTTGAPLISRSRSDGETLQDQRREPLSISTQCSWPS